VRSISNEPVCVPGLTSLTVGTADEVEEALERGGLRRSVAATKCNAQSSRSHSICIVTVTVRKPVSIVVPVVDCNYQQLRYILEGIRRSVAATSHDKEPRIYSRLPC